MNIKKRLSYQFSILTAAILLFFSFLVFYFYYTSQLGKFRKGLLDTAKNSAILLINVAEVDSSLLKKIHRSIISFEDQEIIITDPRLRIIYANNIHYLSEEVARKLLLNEKQPFFTIKEKDGVFYKHKYRNSIYNVLILAYDRGRKESLLQLRSILFWCFLCSICISVILSYFFSLKAIQPISTIIRNMKEINFSRLDKRLDEGNKKDEIDQLAMTFNEMLTNLESSVRNQQEFISNASHELRTPLAVMIVESDFLLNREFPKEEYIKRVSRLNEDLKNLNTQVNSLLELAQISAGYSLKLSEIRIDELVFNAIHDVKMQFSDRKIIPRIEFPENEMELMISGNYGLLLIALRNLIENACKFSEENVLVEILLIPKYTVINISDTGMGIPEPEQIDIFKPFKRASNVRYKSGFGLGLTLVQRIIEVHQAQIKVYSLENKGTRFEIKFKTLY